MKYIIPILFLCAVSFGAYDNSEIEMNAGGWGYASNVANLIAIGTNQMWIDAQNPFRLPTGTHSFTRIRFRTQGNTDMTACRVFVFRITGADMVYVDDRDVFASLDDTGDADVTFATAMEVQDGDLIGIWHTSTTDNVYKATAVGANEYETDADTWRLTDADFTNFQTTRPTSDYTQSTDGSQNCLSMDLYCTLNAFLANTNSSPVVSTSSETNFNYIPSWETTSNPFYIIMEDVVIPDGELLQINIHRRTSNMTSFPPVIFQMNYVAGGDDEKATKDAFVTSQSLADVQAGNQSTDKFDILIWMKAGADADNAEVFYVNKTEGQNGNADAAIKHISLTEGVPFNAVGLSVDPIKRLELLSTNNASPATVGSLIVCRIPVLALGNSFVGEYDTVAKLDYVGEVLGAAFTEERYIINSGIAGAETKTSSIAGSTVHTRWFVNDIDAALAPTAALNGLKHFDDIIICLVNGPSINDIAAISGSDEQTELSDIIKTLARTVKDSLETGNDVIMTEIIPHPTITPAERTGLNKVNFALKMMAWNMSIPFAEVHDIYLLNGGYDGTGTHPDTAGSNWLAGRYAEVYENNTLVSDPGNIRKTRIRYNFGKFYEVSF